MPLLLIIYYFIDYNFTTKLRDAPHKNIVECLHYINLFNTIMF